MRLHRSLTIAAEPSAVFRWIEDPELARRWQPDVAEYAITRQSPDVVGTEFREILEGSGGRLEMQGRISAYEPGTLIGFEVAGPGIEVRSRYELAGSAAETELEVETEVRFGARFSWLLEPLARGKISKQLERELAELQRLCEEEAESRG